MRPAVNPSLGTRRRPATRRCPAPFAGPGPAVRGGPARRAKGPPDLPLAPARPCRLRAQRPVPTSSIAVICDSELVVSRLLKISDFRQPAPGAGQGLLLQSLCIPAIHGSQMHRHTSSTQVLDVWSKPETASSAPRVEIRQGCRISTACQESVPLSAFMRANSSLPATTAWKRSRSAGRAMTRSVHSRTAGRFSRGTRAATCTAQ